LALLAAPLAARLHAQITYVGNLALPSEASFLVAANGTPALQTEGSSSHAVWTSTSEVWIYKADGFHLPMQPPPDALKLTTSSLVAQSGRPTDSWMYATGPRLAFYAYNSATVDLIITNLDMEGSGTSSLASRGDLVTLVTDNRWYAIDPQTGASAQLVGTLGSAPGQIGTAGFGTFGADGMFYLLDQANGVNRVQRFDPTPGLTEAQRYVGGFTVAGSLPLDAGIAISRSGHVYIGDGLGGFSAYDTVGSLLGSYSIADGSSTPFAPGGISSLTLDDDGYLYVFTAGTGLHQYYDAQGLTAIPEPSTYALLGGLVALAMAARRSLGFKK
jgi:hypothetical protein